MNKKFKIVSAVLASSLLIAPTSELVNSYDNAAKAYNKLDYTNHKKINIKNIKHNLSEKDIIELEPFLQAIKDIPNNLLINGTSEEINNFFKQYKIKTNIYNENIGETSKRLKIITPNSSFLGCVGALGWVLTTTAIPAAKVLKIKKYIKGFRSIPDVVRGLLGFKSGAEASLRGLAGLFAELVGIVEVREQCFD